jgi:excisionase family DNA binding protein
VKTLTTGELAKELGVSRGAVLRWATEKIITPEFITAGGHYRWVADDVRAELRRWREQTRG